MRNVRLLIEYDGTDFVGWQIQPNGRSVQQEITSALNRILQHEVSVTGAGRTDSGVHARGQVANFATSSPIDCQSLRHSLNSVLPRDIAIRHVDEVEHGFNARFDATERVYRYSVCTSRHAIARQYVWMVHYSLDVDAMKRSADLIRGEHDFGSFCRLTPDMPHTRCTVYESFWSGTDDILIYQIRANRFLHGMVRGLVGTMVDIGRGHTAEEAFPAILAAKDRQRAGMSAPARGLVLEEVRYGTPSTHKEC